MTTPIKKSDKIKVTNAESTQQSGEKLESDRTCGLVMPIAAWDNCSDSHWSDVKEILFDAIGMAGFKPNLVSDATDIGIIQGRIVQNLYNNSIVVCDVSGRNPNVMFELGLRLAFDKPTVIIKDNKTAYSFDTSLIEHLEYPRDLRFHSIIQFKDRLALKLNASFDKSVKDESYSPFLKHFGEFTASKVATVEVSQSEYVLTNISKLQRSVDDILNYLVLQSKHSTPSIPSLTEQVPEAEVLRRYVKFQILEAVKRQVVNKSNLPRVGSQAEQLLINQIINTCKRNGLRFDAFDSNEIVELVRECFDSLI